MIMIMERMNKKYLSLLIVFAILVSVLSGCGEQSSPEAITKEFFRAVKAGSALLQPHKQSIKR